MAETWVFAYGSLVGRDDVAVLLGRTPRPGADIVAARLHGWRRSWDVCTDNADPDRKITYLCPGLGDVRPDIQVLFLNIRADADAYLDGVLVRADPATLRRLDARERNYDRVDVSASVEIAGQVWAYTGRAEQVARARAGIAAGSARINRAYLDQVEAAYRDHDHLAAVPLNVPSEVRVVRLQRVRHAVRPDVRELPLVHHATIPS